MDDICNLVGNHITKTHQEKLERYNLCGCPSCALRANDIEAWLNSGNQVKVPDDIYDEAHCQPVVTVANNSAWLCHGCLRAVSNSTGRCPYCNARGRF